MKTIYVAGPFRAPTTWQIEQNVRAAESLGLLVAKCGAMPIIPHANTRFFQGELPDSFWLDGTLELLKRSDGMAVRRGWQTSSGTRGEIAWAEANRLPIFYEGSDPRGLEEFITSISERTVVA